MAVLLFNCSKKVRALKHARLQRADGRVRSWHAFLVPIPQLRLSDAAALTAQVSEQGRRAFKLRRCRWVACFEASTPARDPHIPAILSASGARGARV